jgi:hypothetical protein
VSWAPIVDGYALYFNRDERRTRGVGSPPVLRQQDGVSFAAPIDPDAGGTWIGVNDRGVTVCLLNRYGDTPLDPPGPRPSRGLLVLELLAAVDAARVIERVLGRPLGELLPFTICAVDSGGVVHLADWTGTESLLSEVTRPGMVRTSSGSDQRQAEHLRSEALHRLAIGTPISPELLDRFHRSHLPERGRFSVCMHRDEAETQSLSIVRVGRAEAVLEYAAGSPCRGGSSVRARLPLAG